ncbi:MAG: NYN domain-containing protein [Nitrospinota bacterium]
MAKRRVACLVDGFNIYHAIHALRQNHLKWVDLRGVASEFVNPFQEELAEVFYFSAYATWLPGPYRRHRQYVAALQSRDVTAVMSPFKVRPKRCQKCGHQWDEHEEKETDVQIAIYLMRNAFQRSFGKVLLISADSDLTPAVEMARSVAPEVPIHLLVPPGRWNQAHGLQVAASSASRIKRHHLSKNLLPEKVIASGRTIVRPHEYDPP